MRVRIALLALFFSFLPAWCYEPAPAQTKAELHTLKGNVLKGELENITDKEIILKSGGKTIATPLPEVIKLDFPAVMPINKLQGNYSDVELTDGSLLHGKEWTIKGKQVELTTLAGQAIKLPLSAVANILNDAQDENYRKDWKERLARKRRRDVIALIREDSVNAIEGTLGEGDAEGKTIAFELASGKKGNVVLANLHGLIFQRELNPQAPPMLCKLFDSYHDFIMVSGITRTPTGLTVKTPSGAQIDFAQELLTRLDYTLDKIAFLSRLEPSKIVNKSCLYNKGSDSSFLFKRDVNLNNQPLRIYGDNYTVGLALHSHTELEYELKGDYREFHALAGIDQSVGGDGGPVVLVIEGVIDGQTKELYKKTFTRADSKDKKDGTINLNIKDVQKLRLIVRTDDLFDLGKHLDLVNAKVQK